MAALVKIKNLIAPLTTKKHGIIYNIIRTKVQTVNDWKPGPFPETEAERRAAAEKYGLSYEEYEPYPDDGFGHGDYPMLPMKGVALRDPYYPYDFPDEKRNFGETLHAYINILGEDRCDFGEKPVFPYGKVWLYSWGVILTFVGIHYFLRDYPNFRPVLEHQYPKPGAKHYTFEPAR